MKRVATWFAIIALVVGGGVVTFWPIDFWRMFDANQRPLALTEAENWCSGWVGITEQAFEENDPKVLRCMESTSKDNETPSAAQSIGWACDGIIAAGWEGTPTQCLDLLEEIQIWMLAGGGFTNEWSDAYPRPVALDEGIIEDPNSRENRSEGVEPSDYGVSSGNTQTEEDTDE
jgi:hypothetical protein